LRLELQPIPGRTPARTTLAAAHWQPLAPQLSAAAVPIDYLCASIAKGGESRTRTAGDHVQSDEIPLVGTRCISGCMQHWRP
jgi:hypothetical protein